MIDPNAQETDYDDMDPAAIAAEIGSELFTKDDGESSPLEEKPAPVEAKPVETPAVESQAPAIVPGQNSVGKALPKSWKKDMAPHWEKLPPEVHDYVYAREADVMRGIQQYQSGHQQWETLVKPFSPIFQQNPDANPVQIMQGLMNTHLQLLNPSASVEAKQQMAMRILRDYGITLPGHAQPEAVVQAELNTLRQELKALQQSAQQRERAEYASGVNKHLSDIEAFASDPKNEYFNELGADILRYVQTGVADSLASAYEMACWANPGVRAKMLAKQQTQTAAQVQRDSKGKFVNLESDPTPAARTRKSGSIDSTIESIVNSHYSSAH